MLPCHTARVPTDQISVPTTEFSISFTDDHSRTMFLCCLSASLNMKVIMVLEYEESSTYKGKAYSSMIFLLIHHQPEQPFPNTLAINLWFLLQKITDHHRNMLIGWLAAKHQHCHSLRLTVGNDFLLNLHWNQTFKVSINPAHDCDQVMDPWWRPWWPPRWTHDGLVFHPSPRRLWSLDKAATVASVDTRRSRRKRAVCSWVCGCDPAAELGLANPGESTESSVYAEFWRY